MKKTMFALIGAGLLLATPACKKGENDPALSLKSRKGRLTAAWTVSSFMEDDTNIQNYNDDANVDGQLTKSESVESTKFENGAWTSTSKDTDTYDGQGADELTSEISETSKAGTVVSQKYTSVEGGTTYTSESTGVYASSGDWTITFEKDGSFTMDRTMSTTETYTNVEDGYTDVNSSTNTTTYSISGTWSFISKNKTDEFKNKERINLWYKTSTTTSVNSYESVTTDTDDSDFFDYDDTYNSSSTSTWTNSGSDSSPDETWELDMLKGKEVTAIRNYNSTSTGTTTSSTTSGSTTVSSSSNSSSSYTGTTTMNLTKAE